MSEGAIFAYCVTGWMIGVIVVCIQAGLHNEDIEETGDKNDVFFMLFFLWPVAFVLYICHDFYTLGLWLRRRAVRWRQARSEAKPPGVNADL